MRRITYDLDGQAIIEDVHVKDQPTGYDWEATLPQGVQGGHIQFHRENLQMAVMQITVRVSDV